jgi:hypothetical protein
VWAEHTIFLVLQQITTLHAYVSETFGLCKQNLNKLFISSAVLYVPYISKHTLTFISFLYPNPN